MKGLTLTQREHGKLQTMNLVLEGKLGVAEAAAILGLSERHTWRILAEYRRGGAVALAHGNRGHRPANAIPEEKRRQVIMLARTKYAGINNTHLTELLAEREELILSLSTVRNILMGVGLASPRHRRSPRHRCRRERMPQEGVLVQMDGSFHDWLEGRGPWLTLLLSVDDATGTIPYALFRAEEDAGGYFRLLWGIIQTRGVPLAVYTDRHSVFQTPRRPDESLDESLSKERGRTQVGRALRELGVRQVLARSPEAKGRVERMAGTFQDRLVSELRLAGAATIAEANDTLWKFLPGFNQRFGVPPANAENAYRPVTPDLDLAAILCFKQECKVARDNTVKRLERTLQLLPDMVRTSHSGAQVEIQDRLDGSIVVCHQGRVIPTREAPPRPNVLRTDNGEWCNLTTLPKWLTDRDEMDYRPRGRHKTKAPDLQPRGPTPRKVAYWEAVQAARRRGLPIKTIARELEMSRGTVRKYLTISGPVVYPTRPAPNGSTVPALLTESLVGIT